MTHLRLCLSTLFISVSLIGLVGRQAEAISSSNTLTFPNGSTSIAIDANGTFGYSVASTSAGTSANGIYKYSTNPLQIVGSITNQIEFFGTVVISSDGNTGFVLGNRSNVGSIACNCIISSSTIYKLNLTTMTILDSHAFPQLIGEISLDSTGQMIYFASGLKISKIDTTDWSESASFTASGDARFVAFSALRINPSNGDVIAIFKFAALVGSVVSPTTYELQAFRGDLSGRESWAVLGRKPYDMEISRTGSFAIVTDYQDQTATRIDLNSHDVTVIDLYRRYGAIFGAYKVAISPDENFALVGGSGFIDRINLLSNTRGSLTAIPAGKIVFASSGTTALGLNVGSADQKVFLLSVNTLDQQTIETPFLPSEYRVEQGQFSLYATSSSGKQVQYFSDSQSVCVVTGSTLRFVGIGNCTVRATQNGGEGWAAAPEITNSMNVIRNRITFSSLRNLGLTSDSEAVQVRSNGGTQVSIRSDTPTVCEIRDGRVSPLKVGRCQLTAFEGMIASGIRALEVSQSVWIFPDQEIGVSINAGQNFTNKNYVKLNLVWPEGATSVRISNDGGFSSTSTRTSALDLEIPWDLSSGSSSKSTKNVYVRFSGSGIDQTRTFSDDIELDIIAPRISSVQASSSQGATKLKIRATDNRSKISKVIVNSRKSAVGQTVLSYGSTVKVKGGKKNLWIRVQDGAGNLSEWRKI